MATKALTNPFSIRYGTTVPEELYVERPYEEEIITQRVLGHFYSNLSIVGLPKTGKSTLVSHCIVEQADKLAKEMTVVVYYQMGSTRSSMDFYKKIAKKFDRCFQLYYPDDNKYIEFCSPLVTAIKGATCLEDVTDFLDDYFKRVRHIGYKLILILDEFDRSEEIFTFEDFQFLREVSYQPKDKICIVTCSRKLLNDLEKKAPKEDLSVFAMTFKVCPIKMYDEQSLLNYWDLASKYWDFNEINKEFVKFVAGNNPWLMDIINDFQFEHKNIKNHSELLAGVKSLLMNGYDHLISVLDSECLLNAAVQLVEGPLFDVTPIQTEKLLNYGFLTEVTPDNKKAVFSGMELGPIIDGKSYVCFADYCSWDFYRRYYANIPYAEIWSETENRLRKLVKIYLKERYTSNWESDMQQFLTNNLPFKGFNVTHWMSNVQRLKTNMNDMICTFPSMREDHIVDFTLTSQIFDIFIKWDWAWFGNIFQGQKMDWHSKFDHLTKVRNPVAHNNTGDIQAEMEIARTYCLDIRNSIDQWEKKRNVSKHSVKYAP